MKSRDLAATLLAFAVLLVVSFLAFGCTNAENLRGHIYQMDLCAEARKSSGSWISMYRDEKRDFCWMAQGHGITVIPCSLYNECLNGSRFNENQ